ncbi:leucine efflux protein LeuE [Oceanobacter mangrovi]|uniref:leucine efflux protein LeuE n=1 Tax=Oceanobacter mangrovi TaxID=2862510 RepID=UPI001C8EACA5
MFYGITDLTAFVIGTILIVLLPGPNSMYVMSVSARQGIAAGYKGACGVFVGDTILMILSASGVASLVQAYPPLFMALKYAGALYLLWLGFNLLKAGFSGWRQRAEEQLPQTEVQQASSPFRVALTISLLNPKAILFFVSFFIQFVSPDYAWPGLSFLILGAIVQVCSFLYLSALILSGSWLAEAFRKRRRLAAVSTSGIGSLFIGFAVKLAGAGLG